MADPSSSPIDIFLRTLRKQPPLVLGGILVLILVTILLLTRNRQPENMSLEMAMTMVAQATQTAEAANPIGLVLARPTTAEGARSSSPEKSTQSTLDATDTPGATLQKTLTATLAPSIEDSSGGPNSGEASATYPVANVTIRPTYTPRPTATSRPTDRPTATYTPSATPGPGLPGMTIEDVVSALEAEKEFDCSKETDDETLTLWMCDYISGNDLWYHVDIYGTPDIPVRNLLLSVFQTQPDENNSLDILNFVASLRYTGSDPAAARTWITQNLPGLQSNSDISQKTIGKVQFKLYGGPQGRYLEVGNITP